MLCIGLVLLTGCSRPASGPQRFAFSGAVTFDGNPVPTGRIVFEPDTATGNSGPAGYGSIQQGKFATYPSMGAVGGPHIVRISGFDGISAGEAVDGKQLFPEYTTRIDLPLKITTVDFEVPKSPGKPQKPPSWGSLQSPPR